MWAQVDGEHVAGAATVVSTKQVAHFSCEDLCAEPKRVTMAFVARDAGSSAARRRRERRLRSMLRHERMTVAMALAEMTHNSAPRRPMMARAWGEESEMNNAMGQTTPFPRVARTVHFDLFDDGDVLAARPTPIVEVRAIARGTAARRGAHRGHRAVRADPRCACAAVGGPGGGPLA